MYFAKLKASADHDYLAEKFRAGYDWLAKNDIKALAVGKYKIVGDDVVADVQSYETEPAEKRKFETHDKFFDIQYMAEGEEYFGLCAREGLKLKESHPDNDVDFYDDPENFGMILLREGEFIVVAPEEAHKPRCAVRKPAKVKKVVIKVRV